MGRSKRKMSDLNAQTSSKKVKHDDSPAGSVEPPENVTEKQDLLNPGGTEETVENDNKAREAAKTLIDLLGSEKNPGKQDPKPSAAADTSTENEPNPESDVSKEPNTVAPVLDENVPTLTQKEQLEQEPQASTSQVSVVRVGDKRSERLGGHLNTLMRFLNNLENVVRNAYIQEDRGEVSQCNRKFVDDVRETGEQLIAFGKNLVQKSNQLHGAIVKRELQLIEARERQIEAEKRNPSSESDTEEGQAREQAEKEAKAKEASAALAVAREKDVQVSGTVKSVESPEGGKKIRLYVCSLCQAALYDKRMLDDHLQRHTGISLKCTKCEMSITSKIRLKQHIDFHENGPFQCPHCPKEFKWRASLSNHIDEEHRDPDVCKICKKTFKSKYRYNDHMENKHSDGKQVACHLCTVKCKTQAALRVHLCVKHPFKDSQGKRLP